MRPLLALAFIVPTYAFAAGGGDSSPPKTTKTTKECKNSQVWDERKGECVNAQDSKLDDDTLYKGARELAYAGRYEDAQTVLSAMSDQKSDRVLTYLGFTHRKMGDIDRGMAFYQQAIDKNPDNLLARSYMGQGFLEQGDTDAARAQLNEIQARGGKGGWPEKSLRTALKTGKTYDY